MMTVAGRIIPALSVCALCGLAVLPWGLPLSGRLALPFLPVAAIYYWASRFGDRLTPWVPFAAGLVVDVLCDGPLGFWPLVYLCGSALGSEAQSAMARGRAAEWALFAVSASTLAVAGWGVTSVYQWTVTDWRPFAWAAWCAAIAYPLLGAMLTAIDPDPSRHSNDRLVRGI